jgi:hypothetical protein
VHQPREGAHLVRRDQQMHVVAHQRSRAVSQFETEA